MVRKTPVISRGARHGRKLPPRLCEMKETAGTPLRDLASRPDVRRRGQPNRRRVTPTARPSTAPGSLVLRQQPFGALIFRGEHLDRYPVFSAEEPKIRGHEASLDWGSNDSAMRDAQTPHERSFGLDEVNEPLAARRIGAHAA